MKVLGSIKVIEQPIQVSAKFAKQNIVIAEVNVQYPNVYQIEFTNDKIQLTQGLQVGEIVEIEVNVDGREWTAPDGKILYFTSLRGWRINRPQAQPVAQYGQPQYAAPQPPAPQQVAPQPGFTPPAPQQAYSPAPAAPAPPTPGWVK
jgi:hypothetical protein